MLDKVRAGAKGRERDTTRSKKRNLLNIEANGRDCSDDLAKLKLVQNGSLSRGVETNHEDADLPLAKEARKDLGQGDTHDESGVRGRRETAGETRVRVSLSVARVPIHNTGPSAVLVPLAPLHLHDKCHSICLILTID